MKIATIALLILSFTFQVQAAQRLKAKNDSTYMYKTHDGSNEFAILSQNEKVILLQKGMNRSKVKAEGGIVGWVVNSKMEYIANRKGDEYKFKDMVIQGWLDNPSAIYILDETDIEAEAILLTRTFEREIFEFIDRETIERANNEN